MDKNLRKAKTYSISLSPVLAEKLEKTVAERGLSKSNVVAVALDEYFRKEENRDK